MTKSVQKNHDSKNGKIVKKASPPSTASNGNTVAVGITSTKQSMDYVTINGIAQRINYTPDKFPEFILKELMDNALDFLMNSNYLLRIQERKFLMTGNLELPRNGAVFTIYLLNLFKEYSQLWLPCD